MSTISEIKAAISKLPEGEKEEIATWVQSICPGKRRFTDDGLEFDEVKAKVEEAMKGEHHRVNSKEEIRKIMASLDE